MGLRELIPTNFELWMFFYHAPSINGIQNAEIQKRFFVMSSLRYFIEGRDLGIEGL